MQARGVLEFQALREPPSPGHEFASTGSRQSSSRWNEGHISGRAIWVFFLGLWMAKSKNEKRKLQGPEQRHGKQCFNSSTGWPCHTSKNTAICNDDAWRHIDTEAGLFNVAYDCLWWFSTYDGGSFESWGSPRLKPQMPNLERAGNFSNSLGDLMSWSLGKNTIRRQPTLQKCLPKKQQMAKRCSGYLNFETCTRATARLGLILDWLHRLMLPWPLCMTGFREGGTIQTTLEKFKAAELRKAPAQKWTLTVPDCSGMFQYCTSQQRCCLTAHTSQRPFVASEWHDLLHIGWVWAKLGVAGYSNLLHYENLWDGWVRDGNSRLLAWQRLLSRSFHWFSTQRQWNCSKRITEETKTNT